MNSRIPRENMFPDDPWECAYAANRAFNSAQSSREKIDTLEAGSPERFAELASIRMAEEDFANFSDTFNVEEAMQGEHYDFVLRSDNQDQAPQTTFTGFLQGTVEASRIAELQTLVDNFRAQLGGLAAGLTINFEVYDTQHSIREILFDTETLRQLDKPPDQLFKKFIADPKHKSAATLARNALNREKLTTFKDVLALGPEGVVTIRNFGPGCLQVAELLVDKPDIRFVWQEPDRIQRAAMLYDSLDEIPGYMLNPGYSVLTEYSIGQLLAMDIRDIARKLSPGRPSIFDAQRLFDKAVQFETHFIDMRLRLAQQLKKYGLTDVNLQGHKSKED